MKLKLLTAVRHPILKFERLTNTPPGSGVINAVFFLSVTFLCFQIAESVRIHNNAARLYRLARDQIPAAWIFLINPRGLRMLTEIKEACDLFFIPTPAKSQNFLCMRVQCPALRLRSESFFFFSYFFKNIQRMKKASLYGIRRINIFCQLCFINSVLHLGQRTMIRPFPRGMRIFCPHWGHLYI